MKSKVVSMSPNIGVEFGYHEMVYLRGGVGHFQTYRDFDEVQRTKMQPNIGVGIKIKNLTVDYAFTNIGGVSVAPYSNIFSLKLDINKRI
ncbi:MAG: hypothetical protein IH948_05745 [Bacteroidetes bacterium]|nr:hypothetical protein [Bacteroidota bacterium]